MKCLLKYRWVKLPRAHLPAGKGIMGYWARLASKAAFRKGQAKYCGHINEVDVGTWSGGVVGLKSILGIKNRQKTLGIMDTLYRYGFINYSLDQRTKKLSYTINDFVTRCSGKPCIGSSSPYATNGYGFLCMPRDITQRLAESGYLFEDADALLDLWCHTVWQDPNNIFSFTRGLKLTREKPIPPETPIAHSERNMFCDWTPIPQNTMITKIYTAFCILIFQHV